MILTKLYFIINFYLKYYIIKRNTIEFSRDRNPLRTKLIQINRIILLPIVKNNKKGCSIMEQP
jgi:hypothetical protein